MVISKCFLIFDPLTFFLQSLSLNVHENDVNIILQVKVLFLSSMTNLTTKSFCSSAFLSCCCI